MEPSVGCSVATPRTRLRGAGVFNLETVASNVMLEVDLRGEVSRNTGEEYGEGSDVVVQERFVSC